MRPVFGMSSNMEVPPKSLGPNRTHPKDAKGSSLERTTRDELMKTRTFLLVLGIGLSAIALTQTVVSRARLSGYAYNSPYNQFYSMRTQVTFSGIVTGIQKISPMAGMDIGTTLLVKNDDGGGTAIVELGPTWYVDQQVAKVKSKQRVQVTGSKVLINGRGVILAKLVKVGNQVLALRRPNGSPYWDAMMPAADLGPDPNVTEISGTVQAIRTYGIGQDATSGMVVQTSNGTMIVDLGPTWYYDRQGFAFPHGSTVFVTGPGDYILQDGQLMPAYRVRTGNQIYFFRDPITGFGYWRGG